VLADAVNEKEQVLRTKKGGVRMTVGQMTGQACAAVRGSERLQRIMKRQVSTSLTCSEREGKRWGAPSCFCPSRRPRPQARQPPP
jgi:hypothetical protein